MTQSERLPLGSWVDGLTDDHAPRSKLPARYVAEDTKLGSQFAAKAKVCNAVGRALDTLPTEDIASTAWDGRVAAYLSSTYRANVRPELAGPSPALGAHGCA